MKSAWNASLFDHEDPWERQPAVNGCVTGRSDAAPSTAAGRFFSWLASTLPVTDASCLVITHLLPGQMDFLGALGHTTQIAAVLPKPKSANQLVVDETAAIYRCDRLDRAR